STACCDRPQTESFHLRPDTWSLVAHDRLLVLAGGLHHPLGAPLGLQPVRQGLQAGGEGRVGADLLAATPPTSTRATRVRDTDAGHHLVLADIQRRGAFHDQLHRLPPPTYL